MPKCNKSQCRVPQNRYLLPAQGEESSCDPWFLILDSCTVYELKELLKKLGRILLADDSHSLR